MKRVSNNNNVSSVGKQGDELAGLARKLFVMASFVLGLTAMGVAFWMARNVKVRDPDIQNWQGAIGVEILIAVGTSIVSSIVFYTLYSRTAEERVLRNITRASADYATSLFTERFERMLPTKVFPATSLPTAEFDLYFNPMLTRSKTYRFKGDSGSFTSFRVTYLIESTYHLEKEITLLLLDPRETRLFEERAQIELAGSKGQYSRAQLKEKTKEMQNDVYVTLVALFDIRHRINVDVAFHRELMFLRSEIVDDGIFVTYYLGGEFPGTYLYSQNTLAYEAYLMNFRQNCEIAVARFSFNNELEEDSFIAILKELGSETNMEDLRRLKDERFARYREMTARK